MTNKDPLDAYFAAGRDAAPSPSADLTARVLADAAAVSGARAAPLAAARPGFGALLRLIGGWRGATGLGAAAMAGLVLGFVQPDGVPVLGEALFAETDSWEALGFGFGSGTGFDAILEGEG